MIIEGIDQWKMRILGQEIYKEFDYFIRFLHHRVLKVMNRWFQSLRQSIVFSVEKISIVFNVKVKN